MESLTAVVLAAGQGTRMKSQWPKVLHKVCGVPMAEQVIRTVKKAGSEKCVVVTGFKEELVRESLAGENIYFVHQEEQLGTAHAVMQAVPLFKDNRDGYEGIHHFCAGKRSKVSFVRAGIMTAPRLS